MATQTYLDANELVLNMGPQHPSTHGVLRVILKLDGEKIMGTDCVIGYLHRGVEKIAENRTYPMFTPYVDRMDYVASVSNGLGYCLAVENMMAIEAPPKAQAVRVILTELNRITSHLVWLGTHALDIGAITPLFYTFREREEALKIFEAYCGARLTTHAFRIGGLQYDLYETFDAEVKKFCDDFLPRVDDYESLLTGNRIWVDRLTGIGILTADECKQYGVTGPMLRAAGVEWDIRKALPYSGYEKYDFDRAHAPERRHLRSVHRSHARDATVRADHQAGARRHARGADHGQSPQGDQAAGRGSLRIHRSAQRRVGLLHRQRRYEPALSRQGPAAIFH